MSFDYPSYFVKPKIQTSQANSLQVPVNVPLHIIHNSFNPINLYVNNIGLSIMQKPEYDYVVFIILTRDSSNNFCGLLPITISNYINLFAQKININDNPDYVLNNLIRSYGIDPNYINSYGKYTKIKHVEKHIDKSYKIGVLYAPNISQITLNESYQNINNNGHHIEYVDLNRNYKYCNDFTTNNILFALKCMIREMI